MEENDYILGLIKVYGAIKIFVGTRYLKLFDSWICNRNYDNINFPIGEKSNYKYRNVSTLLVTFIIIVKLSHYT